MGQRGRAPRPTKLALLHGERADRLNPAEPIPTDRLPDPPSDCSDEVRGVWDETVEELVAMKIACSADRESLRCYCEAVVRHREACRVLNKSPILVRSYKSGSLMQNPAIRVQRDSAHVIRAFAQEFGLTPSARTRIQTDKANGQGAPASNPFAV